MHLVRGMCVYNMYINIFYLGCFKFVLFKFIIEPTALVDSAERWPCRVDVR